MSGSSPNASSDGLPSQPLPLHLSSRLAARLRSQVPSGQEDKAVRLQQDNQLAGFPLHIKRLECC
ncbi:hypothetical protein [Mycetohabitans sp. B46]|uniref:hypothetical protein n=1 Tax=Mycetohabitans sp. B46 TaxID=2772536 RepID=UPI00307E89BC